MASQLPFRARIAQAILGTKLKDFIPALKPDGGVWYGTGGSGTNDYTSKVDQLSANVGWCFTANNAIVEPTAAIELKLFKYKGKGTGRQGKTREEVTDHEILELIATPNLAQTGEQLRQLHFTYMNFVGESYQYMRDGANPFQPALGKLPDAIDIFPAHKVTFKLGETYTGSTVKYANSDYPAMSFIRDLNPDPNNPYFGRSIIAASAAVIDMERQMLDWNRRKFANDAQPSLIVNVNEPMSNEVYERFQKQINDDHAGVENAGRPWIVEGEGSVTPFVVNNKDLQFLDSRKFSMTEILAMWRVSPGLVGTITDSNRSNLQTAMYQHALINLLPRIRQYVRQLNATLVKPYDPLYELDFVNPVPEDEKANLDYAVAANGKMAWLMVDEVRDMYGLSALPDNLGQQIYMPANNTPLASHGMTPGNPPADDGSSKSLGGVKKKDLTRCMCCDGSGEHETGFEYYRCDATRMEQDAVGPVPCDGREDSPNVWRDEDGNYRHAEERVAPPLHTKAEDTTTERTAEQREAEGEAKVSRDRQRGDVYEAQLVTILRAQFDQQKHDILSQLDTSRIGKTVDGRLYRKKDYLDELISWTEAVEMMRKSVSPILFTLISEQGYDSTTALGLEASMFDPATAAILQYNQDRSTKIAADVNAETEKQLRTALSQGVADGKGTAELRAIVERVMGSASTVRADRIARTETTRAQSYGDIQAWSQSGVVEGKEFYTAHDEHVCNFCNDLDGKIVGIDENFFDKGDVFTVDTTNNKGEATTVSMTMSYDDVPGCPLHAQCRCCLLPVRKIVNDN